MLFNAAARRFRAIFTVGLRTAGGHRWTGFWLLLLGVHLPLVWSDWSALLGGPAREIRWGGFVTLHLSLVFFLLKAARCRWLSLKRDRKSLVLIGVALAVMHGHVLLPDATLGPADLSVAGTIMLLGGLAPLQRLLAELFDDSAVRLRRQMAPRMGLAASLPCLAGRLGLSHSGRAPPRPA